ncbi:acyltransferase family protein [Acidocella aquatica]|uniref:acyltransferase family protein n=1 Tax=Acidocella aquatica TaxID=1922313 RepID=UPI0024E0EA00|nr:acyltransferase [Acidocella aquatica]
MTDQPPPPRLGALELGRFIAASLVVVTHLPALAPALHALALGPLAVQYFFVLSGFVMVAAHHGDPKTWARPLNFWWRRACRIYPLYWLILLPVLLAGWHEIPRGALWHLVSLDPAAYPEIIPAAWTLRYELAFYLMFGLCLTPIIGRYVLGFWVFSVLWLYLPPAIRWCTWLRGWHWMKGGLVVKSLATVNVYLLQSSNHFISAWEVLFFAGLAAGWLFVTLRPSLLAGAAALALGAALCLHSLALSKWGTDYPSELQIPLAALGYALLLYGLVVLEACQLFRCGQWAQRLGAMSYPLYIAHMPLIVLLGWMLPAHTAAPAILAAIYLVGIILTFYVDRPLQRALRGIPRRLGPQ